MQDNWVTHALASACAGLSAAVVSLPSDVVKTRMMDQIRHELDAKMLVDFILTRSFFLEVFDFHYLFVQNAL